MVFICLSLCPLDTENLLWSSLQLAISTREGKDNRNTYTELRQKTKKKEGKKRKKKIYSLITYQSDFRHLSTHSIILYSPRMSSYFECCT